MWSITCIAKPIGSLRPCSQPRKVPTGTRKCLRSLSETNLRRSQQGGSPAVGLSELVGLPGCVLHSSSVQPNPAAAGEAIKGESNCRDVKRGPHGCRWLKSWHDAGPVGKGVSLDSRGLSTGFVSAIWHPKVPFSLQKQQDMKA